MHSDPLHKRYVLLVNRDSETAEGFKAAMEMISETGLAKIYHFEEASRYKENPPDGRWRILANVDSWEEAEPIRREHLLNLWSQFGDEIS